MLKLCHTIEVIQYNLEISICLCYSNADYETNNPQKKLFPAPGHVSGVNENEACSWTECSRCGSEDLLQRQ